MSGSSGGIGPTLDEEKPNCKDLSIRTHLSSPNPDIITNLEKGDVLSIQLGGPRGPIEVVTNNGEVAGSLLSGQQLRLIECINEGNEYVGTIKEIEEGNCEVLIRSAE